MGLPQENSLGYDAYAPLDHVQNMQGNLLIVHGTADDNVHVQNSMRLIDALVSANKEFDWLIYPDKNHGIYGGYTRLHLYQKMTEFLKKHLMHPSPLE
jgi:dipeptidyl-peptidase-4